MAQPFNPKRVLRQVSKELLKEFFGQLGLSPVEDWDQPNSRLVDELYDAWQGLPDLQRKDVEVVLQDVHEMANEDGTRIIIEEALYRGENLVPLLEPMESRYDKAIWTAMHHPSIWEAARRFTLAESFFHGRSWEKRNNMPSTELKADAEALEKLQDALSAFYRERQGRGHHCKVQHFPRGKDCHYFFVYLSDYANTYINFDNFGHFQRTPERRAFEVVVAYDRQACSLDIYARGGKKTTDPLISIFSSIILGEPPVPDIPGADPYRLDDLMDRGFTCPTDPEDGIECVAVRALRLAIIGGNRDRIILEPDPEAGPEHIHDMLEEYLNRLRLSKSILHVTRATFNLKLNGNGRAQSLTFSVTYPNGCDLKSKREEHRLLGEKYLKRWGICVL